MNGVVNLEAEISWNDVTESKLSRVVCIYIRDKLNAGGRCLSAVTAIGSCEGCMKFRELSGVSPIVWKEMVSEDEREGV